MILSPYSVKSFFVIDLKLRELIDPIIEPINQDSSDLSLGLEL